MYEHSMGTHEESRSTFIKHIHQEDRANIESGYYTNTSAKQESDRPRLCCSYRLVLAFICCAGSILLYTQRGALSVAIVCMVNSTAQKSGSSSADATNITQIKDSIKCYARGEDSNAITGGGEFWWSKELQGLLLAGVYWGYMVGNLPGGLLAHSLGSKRTIGAAFSIMAAISLLSPIAAKTSPYLLLALRIFLGLVQGAYYPAISNLWARWAPPLERSFLLGLSYVGCELGTMIAFTTSGWLCRFGFAGGWPSIFYIWGGGAAVWLFLWLLAATDSPTRDSKLSAAERQYVTTSVGSQTGASQASLDRKSVPWRAILTSRPVWAAIIYHVCANWGGFGLSATLPTYMAEVHGFRIQNNGMLSALPYFCLLLVSISSGGLADRLRSKYMSTRNVRRLFGLLGSVIPAVFMLAAGFMDCSLSWLAITVITLGVGATGFQYSSMVVNYVDLAPRYASVLMGISNTLAASAGIVAPYVASLLTTHKSQQEWMVFFYIMAAVYVFGGLVYAILCDGEAQGWALSPQNKQEVLLNNTNSLSLEERGRTSEINLQITKKRKS